MLPAVLHLNALRSLYAADPSALEKVIDALCNRIDHYPDKAVFISRAPQADLKREAVALLERVPDPGSLPLWGIPFAVKDNIDVAGLPTTAACPAFAYVPSQDAAVVARLKAAGALVIGKTNLDQFATGLNGTRSPYGAPRSVFSPDLISGGSSSGSAVAVAAGLAAFALGTDTAGSGRVPAAFNNIVGVKPTPGLLSTTGVVPACRSLDCVSILSASVADGVRIRRVAEGFDASDAFSIQAKPATLPKRPRIGVLPPAQREFCGDEDYAALYEQAIVRAATFGDVVEFDYGPFQEAAALLYEGPWVAERLAAVEAFHAKSASEMDPTVRTIVEGAQGRSAVDLFRGLYRLAELKRVTAVAWNAMDVMLLPSVPTTYTVEAMLADPIRLNASLGLYTNFVNLLGYAAVAVPSGFRSDGVPFGVTFIAQGCTDDALARLSSGFHVVSSTGAGRARQAVPNRPLLPQVEESRLEIAVVGAHLSGQPLNWQLTEVDGKLMETTRTASGYRLFVLPDTDPPKPGLIREPAFNGQGLEVEVWSLPADAFGRFVADIPAPLGVGKITLADGRAVTGFLCEPYALEGAHEITALGGWRAFRREAAAG
jgi:allophanate hydrolase